ncbi:MAG: hypothetical protein GYB65_24045 [Chloroflexi bacterium]|nr:hypothetical protein [Chloroflexota bacterium]
MSENQTPSPEIDRPARRRDRPRQVSSLQILFASILSVGLLLVINFSGRIARGQQMDTERKRLQATIDVLEQQRISLEEQRAYAASDSSVIEWAHTESKQVLDGEVLIIPIPAVTSIATFGEEDNTGSGDVFMLREYSVPESISAGSTISASFWWTTSDVPQRDYTLSVMLVDTSGEVVAQHGRPMIDGNDTTSTWQPNTLKNDTYRLTIPVTLRPGTYQLRLELYWTGDNVRLPVEMEDVRDLTYAPLARVRVISNEPEPETPNWHLWWNLFFDREPPF